MLYSTVWDFQAKVIVIAALVIYEMMFLLHLCCIWLFLFVVSDSSYSADVLNYVYRVVWYLCYCFLYYLCLVALLFIVCTLLVKQFSGWVLLEGVIIWLFLLLYVCVHYLLRDVVQWCMSNVVAVPFVLFCIALCWYHSSCWLATLLLSLAGPVLFYVVCKLQPCHWEAAQNTLHPITIFLICTCNLGMEELSCCPRLWNCDNWRHEIPTNLMNVCMSSNLLVMLLPHTG